VSPRWAAPALLVLALVPGAARAGGFLEYDTAGNPVHWDASTPVPYKVDQGLLGNQSQGSAVAMVDGLFGAWQSVPTSILQFTNQGSLSQDVTVANYGPYLGPYGTGTTPRGENAVVFDADGSIFDDLFGVGTGVLGFAGPTFFSDGTTTVAVGNPIPPGSRVIEGVAFLNGKFIDGISTPSNQEVTLTMFQAAVLHELGHFSGLDHTQLHPLAGFKRADGTRLGSIADTETMYPYIGTEDQATLSMDDRVALSRLYPSSSFASSTGCLTGHILGADGSLVSGADVVALNTATTSEAVSDVSGADRLPADAGSYRLCGLVPGHSYALEVQEIDGFERSGSRVGPFDPPLPLPGPPEAWNGPYESSDPALDDPTQATTQTAPTGTTPGIDLRLNAQRFAVSNLPWPGDATPNPDAAPSGLVLGDFDGDGKADVVGVQQGFSPGNQVRFAHGRGDGTFDAAVRVDDVPGGVEIVAGQFNPTTDSFLDIAVLSSNGKDLRLYLGQGNGTFAAPTSVVPSPPSPGAATAVAIAAGDLNNDGRSDLLYLRRESDGSITVLALLADGGGGFTTVTSTVDASVGWSLETGQSVVLGQFEGSAIDAAFVLPSAPGIAVLIGSGSGSFVPGTQSETSISGRFGTALAAADFDGDGRTDLAVPDYAPNGLSANFESSYVDLLHNDQLSGLTLGTRFAVPEVVVGSLLTGDFNRDGHADVVAAGAHLNPGDPGAKVTLAFGDGQGGILSMPGPLAPSPTATVWGLAEFPAALYPGEMQSADLNGDGRPDLVVSDHSTDVFGLGYYAPKISVLLAQDLPIERARDFYTVTPCRVFDSRNGAPLFSGGQRTLQVGAACGVPASAKSLSVNVTAIQPTGLGFLQFFAGPLGPPPATSTLSFATGVTRANNAILLLSPDGSGRAVVKATVANNGSVHLAIDVNGYFQ